MALVKLVGLDLGQTQDYTALAVLRRPRRVDAFEVIFFDRSGRLDPKTYTALKARCNDGKVHVIPGFYGQSATGEVKTFSRGGSDVTGAVVANIELSRAISSSLST